MPANTLATLAADFLASVGFGSSISPRLLSPEFPQIVLPPTGAVIFCPPLKIKQGSGSPIRALALVPG